MSVEPPDHLQCPILYVLFRDPVIISSGRTYERDAVEGLFEEAKKLESKPVDPVSREEVAGEVWTNWQIRDAVEAFLEENPGYDPGWGGRALAPPLGVTRMSGATANLQQNVNELQLPPQAAEELQEMQQAAEELQQEMQQAAEELQQEMQQAVVEKLQELQQKAKRAEELEEMNAQQRGYAFYSIWSLLYLWISLWAGFAPTSWADLSLVTKAIVLGGAFMGIWAVCQTVAVIYIDVLERALLPTTWGGIRNDCGGSPRGFWMGSVTLPLLFPCWCWRGKAFFGLEWFVALDDSSLGGYRWYSQIFWISLWLVFLRLANEATIRIWIYGRIVWRRMRRQFRQKSAQQQQ